MYFFSFTYGWKKGGGSESLQIALTAWMSPRGAVTCNSGLQAWLPAESMFRLQGVTAGKVPECVKCSFQPKFRPKFCLIPNWVFSYWISLAFRNAWPVVSVEAQELGGFLDHLHLAVVCLRQSFQLPKMDKIAFPYFTGDLWGSMCLRLWQ